LLASLELLMRRLRRPKALLVAVRVSLEVKVPAVDHQAEDVAVLVDEVPEVDVLLALRKVLPLRPLFHPAMSFL
jgi:hypothetical protein